MIEIYNVKIRILPISSKNKSEASSQMCYLCSAELFQDETDFVEIIRNTGIAQTMST